MLSLFAFAVIAVQQAPVPSVIPLPQSITALKGSRFPFEPGMVILAREDSPALEHLEALIRFCTGESPDVVQSLNRRHNRPVITVQKSEALGAEGYRLFAEGNDMVVQYGGDAGLFYAVQSMRQLLPNEVEMQTLPRRIDWSIPAVRIEDRPRFSWRGMHLDVSRHFFDVAFIKRYIDYIAMHKMNVFHWHLIDDGGWRMQVKRYPWLTDVGAWRAGNAGEWDYGDIRMLFDPDENPRYGGYYTQEEIREVVQYAADRYVTVVPEIELPGHTTPSIVAYPFLGCDGVPPHEQKGRTITNVYCPGKDTTFEFLEGVLTETMEMFPSEYIHIGGDEVNKRFWENCPKCEQRMEHEGLEDVDELQSYFIKRIEKFLNDNGRRLIGWDEILEGGLAPAATVMSWRGTAGGIAAARAGHDVVMSPTSHSYFDYSYDAISTEHVYGWNPVPEELTEEEGKHVLGGQANVWTEWIPTPERAEFMIFPRMLATAEVLWTDKDNKDWDRFNERVMGYFGRLDAMGAVYHLPAPQVEFTAAIFQGSTTVSAKTVDGTPFTIRFTLDGTDPDGRSRKYDGPIFVDRDLTVSFALVSKAGRPGAVVRVQCVKQNPSDATGLTPGLDFAVYEGEWQTVPKFKDLTPMKTGTTNEIGLAERTRDDNFAMRFSGYFKAEQDGVYKFRIGSDDGSYLAIAGAKVVDHDGLHGYSEKTGTVRLAAGVYPIEIAHFEAGGSERLTLQVQLPGGDWAPLPPGLLLRKDG
ncbi:MAG: family 20 glycosylhydrolase [Armatimonadetes bacterium]|nr:family 20 glycosylhydrolase [Armatimonadota bacterium]